MGGFRSEEAASAYDTERKLQIYENVDSENADNECPHVFT
jgi:hypothetical protein